MFIPFIIFGVVMVSVGVYSLVTKNIFKRYEWKRIVEALRLSGNAVRVISVVYGVLIICIGSYFLINGVISSDPFSAFWFVLQ